ncbi:MAG: hypothetical protein HYY16_16070 [Planctomycetes bacterium]|nr:hypothetical protein [Planctomycetota bacterium]
MPSSERRYRWMPYLAGAAFVLAVLGVVVALTASRPSDLPHRLDEDAPKAASEQVWETDRIYVEMPISESESESISESEPESESESEPETEPESDNEP